MSFVSQYPILPLEEVLKYEQEAVDNKVSKVARSKRGWLSYHKKHIDNKLDDEVWLKKRESFIARTLAAYNKKNPTYRRYLSLIMWSYMPELKPEIKK